MARQNPIPIVGRDPTVTPADAASLLSPLAGPFFGRGHIPLHTGWRLLVLWATIIRFSIFSLLLRLRHSGLLPLHNELPVGLCFFRRSRQPIAKFHQLLYGITCPIVNKSDGFVPPTVSARLSLTSLEAVRSSKNDEYS